MGFVGDGVLSSALEWFRGGFIGGGWFSPVAGCFRWCCRGGFLGSRLILLVVRFCWRWGGFGVVLVMSTLMVAMVDMGVVTTCLSTMVVSLWTRKKEVLTLAQHDTTNVALLHSFEDSDVALFTSDLVWRGGEYKVGGRYASITMYANHHWEVSRQVGEADIRSWWWWE